jgi:cysteine desulfurase
MVYLDNASTTPVADEVIGDILACLGSGGSYGNPSAASYSIGRIAYDKLQHARKIVSDEFNCEPGEVVFTSGATESNNLAIRGAALAHKSRGRHLITSTIEHKSVLETFRRLEQDGFKVSYLHTDSNGRIDPRAVSEAITPETLLVSVMHVNNETGTVQDIKAIGEVAQDAGVLFHVDAAQSAGKFAIDLADVSVDLLSLSGHKFYGPKGVGCLVIRNRRLLALEPLLLGGGQEFGVRSGTVAVHQAVGLASALKYASARREADFAYVETLRHFFITALRDRFTVFINGDEHSSSPYIVNFSIDGIAGNALVNQLAQDVALSTGSACNSGAIEPSYVLQAMGITGKRLDGGIRASFGRYHAMRDIEIAVAHIDDAVRRMQRLD